MKVTLIEEDVVNRLVTKIDQLESKFEKIVQQAKYPLKEKWLSNDEAIEVLKCSKKTLQSYRTTCKLPFSQINQKIYFKSTDIEKFFQSNYRSLRGF